MVFMQMKKQKLQNKIKLILTSGSAILILSIFALSGPLSKVVLADQFDEQIQRIQADNAVKQDAANQLQVQAQSYQGEIDRLQGQINGIRQQIAASEAKKADIENQIVQAQKELDEQKRLLGVNIRTMYLEGEISTLEMLASSKDLSDFLNKQEYHTAVQSKIKLTLDKITVLKAQLKTQKLEVEKLLADQQAMNQQLSGSQRQQSNLLAYTEGQKSQYNSQITANQGAITELKRQQIIANARFSGGAPGTGPTCGGGYPARLCQIAQDSAIDDWGMYNRECVSYTAFKVAQSGRHMPYWGGYGNANQWDDNARAEDITVDGTPRVGDVAHTDRGYYGHVMYVEYVYGDGTILISQYNVNLDGRYSEKRINAAGLNFIHFP